MRLFLSFHSVVDIHGQDEVLPVDIDLFLFL